MSYALIQVLRRVWRPLVPVLSTAGALALFYWLAISYHATTIVAKNVQLVSVRQKKEMTKVPQHLAFDDEWVRSLRRILLVGPRSPEATDAPETVLWQIGPGPLPQLELVTPARDDAQIAIEVGASSEPNAVDLYLTPATDASCATRVSASFSNGQFRPDTRCTCGPRLWAGRSRFPSFRACMPAGFWLERSRPTSTLSPRLTWAKKAAPETRSI